MTVRVKTTHGSNEYPHGLNVKVEDGHLIVYGATTPKVIAIHAPGHWQSASVIPANGQVIE